MNRYLEGPYAPVDVETTAFDLPITGTLPDVLDGRYLRNGPNPMAVPDPDSYHWFTGDGMVHGIRLRGGKAEWYRNRWVRSTGVAEALGEPARSGPTHGGMDFASNTNVIGLGGRTFAIVEAGSNPYELTDDLDTIGPCDLGLGGGYTAHPKVDPVTGEAHSISYHWAWGNQVRYDVLGPDCSVRSSTMIDVGGAISLHDCAITERFVIVLDLPVVFDIDAAMDGRGFPYGWSDSHVPRVGLVRRDDPSAPPQWFDVSPCYVFHPLNAYDDGDRVIVDVVRHPSMFRTERNGPDEGPPTLDRWTLDLTSGKLTEDRFDDVAQEFPRVDERLVGRRHRFGYTAGFPGNVLVRHDLVTGSVERRPTPGAPGECVFVPAGPDADETDGYVLSLVLDEARGATDLLVLNAGDFTGNPAAVVHLPARVPLGFHGNFVAT